jgi:hypothetical protein
MMTKKRVDVSIQRMGWGDPSTEEVDVAQEASTRKIAQSQYLADQETKAFLDAASAKKPHREFYEWCPHGTFNPKGCGACKSIRKPHEDLARAHELLANLLEWAEERVGADEPWPDCITEARAELDR